jgi:hypothetical protein
MLSLYSIVSSLTNSEEARIGNKVITFKSAIDRESNEERLLHGLRLYQQPKSHPSISDIPMSSIGSE